MNKLIHLIVLSGCIAGIVSYFLAPAILDLKPANKIICSDPRNEPVLPGLPQFGYLSCVNEAVIKIKSASLVLTKPDECPLQWVNTPVNSVPQKLNVGVNTCPGGNYANNDVTVLLKSLCNSKTDCQFQFSQLPELQCLLPCSITTNNGSPAIPNPSSWPSCTVPPVVGALPRCTHLAPRNILSCPTTPSFRGLNVTYSCQQIRKTFRPFPNKRYDPKFSRTLNHQFRKLSMNRIMSL